MGRAELGSHCGPSDGMAVTKTKVLSPQRKRSWASCHPQDLPALEEGLTTALHLLRTSFSPHNYAISHGWLWGDGPSFDFLHRDLKHPHRSTWGWGLLGPPEEGLCKRPPYLLNGGKHRSHLPASCNSDACNSAKAGPSSTWQARGG